MKNKLVILSVFLLIILPSINAMRISSQSCDNSGTFKITLEAGDFNITYTNEINILVDGKKINGEWNLNFLRKNPPDRSRQYATFSSDEGVVNGGNKIIEVIYPLESDEAKTIGKLQEILQCPEFHFSCALLDIKIDECSTDKNTFKGFFYAKGFEQSNIGKLDLEKNLEFNFYTTEPYEDVGNKITTKGLKPRGATVEKYEGEKYLITKEFLGNNRVERLRVGLANVGFCFSDKYYKYGLNLSDVSECYIKEEIIKIKEEIIEPVEEVAIPEEVIVEEAVITDVENVVGEENDLREALIVVGIIIVISIVFIRFRKKF